MTEDFKTAGEAFIWAVKRLEQGGIPGPEAEAEFLLTHVLAIKRHRLFLEPGRILTPGEASSFRSFVERRLGREPSQYITGEVEFRGLKLKVTRATLIPRPETELLVDEAVKAVKGFSGQDIRIMDLCTGSGCIALSVAQEIGGSLVYATDISAEALEVARENALKNGLSDRVEFFRGDLFDPLRERGLEGKAQVVLSNPPYINKKDMEALEPEVKDFEPEEALYGGEDGLVFIRRIITEAPFFLASWGWLMMELGYGQAEDVKNAASATGRYGDISIIKDYSGIGRILKARIVK